MLELSKTILNAPLWITTLAESSNDPQKNERERLRASFVSFRSRVALLAQQISKDLPDLTIHDVTHLDALWEVASQITGESFLITPTESYVLGGAILLHDLAMSIAATPGGFSALKSDVRWGDIVFMSHKELGLPPPTRGQIDSPSGDIQRHAVFLLLRQVHAENAEKLAFQSFSSEFNEQQFLIEDTELRQTFGRVIGKIAHSHWWSLDELEKNFDRQIGAPHWAPPSWTIDPLKIACILRAADAAHIDARRAPTFLKAFATISASSRVHWTFQERINKAYLRDDALVFTSGRAFPLADASAWWLCLDTLRMVDRELRGIDSLLADRALPRFAAKRVAGVDHPERIASYIQTENWHPINAIVHISDLPQIIRSLGGEELYGKKPLVPLRELLQNASDAIRARRFYEHRQKDFGEINVSLIEEEGSYYLRVEDNGVGMSQRVLTEFLLDFGSSFWSKPQVQEEFPGLASSGFESTGRYGIGFFSVFMAADRVTVFTRRPDAAAKDTLVLEFGSGLSGRPILRPALSKEQLRDGGTVVQLLLRTSPFGKDGLLFDEEEKPPFSLTEVCRQIAPALDTRVSVLINSQVETAIQPDDWLTIPGEQLLMRLKMKEFSRTFSVEEVSDFSAKASKNLRTITDEVGNIVARACVTPAFRAYLIDEPNLRGAVTVGGFTTSPLHGIAGIMLGQSTRAARDRASPIVDNARLALWADEQADLVSELYSDPRGRSSAAQIIRLCGGDTKDLPIAMHRGKWVSARDISRMHLPDEILIVDTFVQETELKHVEGFEFDENVFVTESSGMPVIFQDNFDGVSYGGTCLYRQNKMPTNLSGAVLEAVAVAWGIACEEISGKHDFEKEQVVRIGCSKLGEARAEAITVRRA